MVLQVVAFFSQFWFIFSDLTVFFSFSSISNFLIFWLFLKTAQFRTKLNSAILKTFFLVFRKRGNSANLFNSECCSIPIYWKFLILISFWFVRDCFILLKISQNLINTKIRSFEPQFYSARVVSAVTCNVVVYIKLRLKSTAIFQRKIDVGKKATNFTKAKTRNFV